MGKATSKVRRNHYKIERRRNDDLVEYSVKKLGQTNVSKKKIGRVLLFATISFFVFYLAFSLFCIGLIIAINNGKSTKKTIVNDIETKVNTIDYTKEVDVQEPVVQACSRTLICAILNCQVVRIVLSCNNVLGLIIDESHVLQRD